MILMLLDETRRRQNELNQLLKEMALSCMDENEICTTATKLKNLYTGGFRHKYSEFFPLIAEISKDDNEYELDFLSNNLRDACSFVEKNYLDGDQEFTTLYRPLSKISDHLNLEIARYQYNSLSEQNVKDLEKRNQVLQNELKETTLKLEEAQQKVGSVQTELISVLSIFAAIVLTFSGSMSLLGSALTSMENAPFFKSVFFVLLCGFILCNAIFLMMYLVGKITGRNIYARCKSKDCTCGKDGTPKCLGINRVRKRLPYVFWLNASLCLFMLIDVVVWYLDKLYNIIP